MKTSDWLTLAAVLGVGYVAYKATRVVGEAASAAGAAVGTAYTGAVNWTSDLFSSWFGPDIVGSDVYRIVNFPDGSRHAIGANLVDPNGKFEYNGYPYQLGKDSAGNWVAV